MSETGTRAPKTLEENAAVQLPDETISTINRLESTTLPHALGAASLTRGANALAQVIDIDRLWEAPPSGRANISRALELLKEASDYLSEARKHDDALQADRYVQHVQLTLPKLFACRSVGDGFGVIVNSLHFAFVNLHGKPLTRDQINVVWRVLRELRSRPVMPLERGIQQVEEFEEHGLEVDPPDIGDLLKPIEFEEND